MKEDPAIKFMQSKYKSSQNIGNDKILYKFDDDRYPDTTSNCQNVTYKNVNVTSDNDNILNPPNPNGPTIVDVDVNLEKLKNVNPDENTYDARGTLSLVWCDPRLKFDSKLGKYKLINDESANLTLK